MKCFNCNLKVSGGNKRKIQGVWMHKRCPGQKGFKKKTGYSRPLKKEKEIIGG
jgi:hypothetical protein